MRKGSWPCARGCPVLAAARRPGRRREPLLYRGTRRRLASPSSAGASRRPDDEPQTWWNLLNELYIRVISLLGSGRAPARCATPPVSHCAFAPSGDLTRYIASVFPHAREPQREVRRQDRRSTSNGEPRHHHVICARCAQAPFRNFSLLGTASFRRARPAVGGAGSAAVDRRGRPPLPGRPSAVGPRRWSPLRSGWSPVAWVRDGSVDKSDRSAPPWAPCRRRNQLRCHVSVKCSSTSGARPGACGSAGIPTPA